MLPHQVILTVGSTDIVAKGDEKSPQYKPATVGAGRKIMVPPFIAPGKLVKLLKHCQYAVWSHLSSLGDDLVVLPCRGKNCC